MDAEQDLRLVLELGQQPHLHIRIESGQHAGRVVVEQQLASEFQVQLVAELLDTIEDGTGLFLQVLCTVKAYGVLHRCSFAPLSTLCSRSGSKRGPTATSAVAALHLASVTVCVQNVAPPRRARWRPFTLRASRSVSKTWLHRDERGGDPSPCERHGLCPKRGSTATSAVAALHLASVTVCVQNVAPPRRARWRPFTLRASRSVSKTWLHRDERGGGPSPCERHDLCPKRGSTATSAVATLHLASVTVCVQNVAPPRRARWRSFTLRASRSVSKTWLHRDERGGDPSPCERHGLCPKRGSTATSAVAALHLASVTVCVQNVAPPRRARWRPFTLRASRSVSKTWPHRDERGGGPSPCERHGLCPKRGPTATSAVAARTPTRGVRSRVQSLKSKI